MDLILLWRICQFDRYRNNYESNLVRVLHSTTQVLNERNVAFHISSCLCTESIIKVKFVTTYEVFFEKGRLIRVSQRFKVIGPVKGHETSVKD